MIATTLPTGSVYEQSAYLRASASHEHAELELVGVDGAVLPLLRYESGERRTVYGLPRPLLAAPDQPSKSLHALAETLCGDPSPLTAVLSPISPGPELAARLIERGAERIGERPIAITELDGGDPEPRFSRRGRRAIRTALGRGIELQIGPLAPSFGGFYRAAMAELEAEPIYFFADEYFEALGELAHFQVSVVDAGGVAAAALFLHDGAEAYYHLGGRRANGTPPVLGAMSVALGEGIREAWRRGCTRAILGGGRTAAADDPLLAFKLQLSTATLPRLTVKAGR